MAVPTPKGGKVADAQTTKTTAARRAPRRSRSQADRARDAGVVTGFDWVMVNAADGICYQVREGDKIPECSAEEIARLDSIGAFGEHPREEAQRRMDDLVAAGLAARMEEPARSAEEQKAGESGLADDNEGEKLPEIDLTTGDIATSG